MVCHLGLRPCCCNLLSISVQDVSQDDIPIMLVGNKSDLREQALQDGITCVSTSYGEKLAMVRPLNLNVLALLLNNRAKLCYLWQEKSKP